MTSPAPVPPPGAYASRAAFAEALCQFINRELPALHPKMRPAPNVRPDTPLFAQGLIDSMAILHVIAFIEQATGRGIPTERVVMKHFATVAAMAETFGPAA